MNSTVKTRELFPPPVINLWNQWQLRHLVLLSFTLQAILAILGNRRNTTTSMIMRMVIWLSYLFADAVAGLALGIFSQKDPEEKSLVLVLWIPLLLLHLGGPDFITAYALEDNQLWLRHLLGLVTQVVGAFYVFFKSWDTHSPITFLAIPLFVAGLIKYGERTWALKSATSEKFIEIARRSSSSSRLGDAIQDEFNIARRTLDDHPTEEAGSSSSSSTSSASAKMNLICKAYKLLNVSGTLLTDEKNDGLVWRCTCMVKLADVNSVYDMIDIQLGLLYNWFYTKSQVFYSPTGFIIRLISFCCVIAVTVAFSVIHHHSMRDFDKVDVVFSYILLAGAILLEIYSLTLLLLTDWLVILLCSTKRGRLVKTAEAICKLKLSTDGSKWSGTIGRFSMHNYAFGKGPTMMRCISEKWDKHFYKTREALPRNFKEIVFRELVDDRRGYSAKWSKGIEEKYGINERRLRWIFDFSFSSSILIWHLATEILYLLDSDESDPYRELNGLKVVPNRENSLEISKSSRDLSRLISEYMMSLLLWCPSMIPGGVQEHKVQEATSWIRSLVESSSEKARREAYARILFCTFHRDYSEYQYKLERHFIEPDKIKLPEKGEMREACKLADMFLSNSGGRTWTEQRRWKMIREVWLEMLFYAANQCKWEAHVQHLRRGGEFLTHVWMLMLLLGAGDDN